MYFKELRSKNVLLYKDARFDLGYKGLSVIYGANRDAGRGSTNAAGKSLFFSQIPELLGITLPISKKAGKIKKGLSALSFSKADVDYKVVKKRKKNREKIILFENGKNTDAARKGYAQKKISKIHGWSEDEFYSTVYIDSRRPNPLHLGSTKQRRDFIISMFRLSNVDNLRKIFNAELRRISEEKSVYEEIKRQYKSLSEQLVDESELELKDKVERLESVYKKLSVRVERATEIKELLHFRFENKKAIKRLLKLTKGDLSLVNEAVSKIQRDTERLEADLKHAVGWTKYKENSREYREKAIPLLKKLAKYEHISIEAAEIGSSKHGISIHKLEVLQKELDLTRQNLPEKVEIDEEDLKLDSDNIRANLLNYKKLFKQAKNFKDGTCPLCKSPVKIHNKKNIVRKIRHLKEKLRLADRARSGVEQRDRRRKDIRTITRLKEEKIILERKITKYAKYKKVAALYSNIPEQPKEFKGKKLDESTIRELLAQNNKRVDFLKTMTPLIDKIKRARKLSEEDKQETYHLDILRKRLGKIIETLPAMKSSYDKMRVVKNELGKLKERAKELQGSVKDEEAFELLVEAYGNSGIKKLMLQRIGSHLEKCLNRYSRFVFSERYDFKVNIDTQFDIVVRRMLADRTLISDVRQLSGAESKAFILLLYLSLLSLIPANRRSNILVLDEPDANLGPEMRENLKRFIPILNKIVPHIIIITPHTDMRYDGARTFTVIKEKGYSRIMETK